MFAAKENNKKLALANKERLLDRRRSFIFPITKNTKKKKKNLLGLKKTITHVTKKFMMQKL